MSIHHTQLNWKLTAESFAYETFNREHTMTYKDGLSIPASSAPDYLGKPAHVDPEEALIGAVSSCHMLTFLALASKKRYTVSAYADNAQGTLEKNNDGVLAITTIQLHPKITFEGEKIPNAEELAAMHDKAHQHCFIANSIKAKVTVQNEV
ncbi:MAG: OsmC family protein [bacterium]|nr:OsmC family protein [bacterium]